MKRKHTPYFFIAISFIGAILIGTFLLMLPWATKGESFGFVDAFFMSSSAVCVTGLSIVSNVGETLTIFGKVVLALLIEVGGISILTIGVFILIIIGKKVGMSSRFLMKEALNQSSLKGIVRLVKKIILMAAIFQLVGLIVNMFVFLPEYGNFWKALGISAFHSLSSFNNAGFDIFGGTNSMIPYASNILLNINTMFLIIMGGLGFIVIFDIFNKKKNFLSLHSKVVLSTTAFLIVVGTLFVKLGMGGRITWLEAIFTSVTSRTAGFATIDMSELTGPAYLQVIVLMFVGASPCSTGGGVKTTTFFVIILTIFSLARGKRVTAFRRQIARESILRAFSLVVLAIFWICIISFIIALVDPEFTIDKVVFESVSAFGTVGLSQGISSAASTSFITKLLLSVTMLFGRLGPLTILSLWNKNWLNNSKESVRYLEEKMIIG